MATFGEKYLEDRRYEEAEKEARAHWDSVQDSGTMFSISRIEAKRIYDGLWESAPQAKDRVKKLCTRTRGREVAITLSEEYERLRARAQTAILALVDFERKLLNMRKERPKEESR